MMVRTVLWQAESGEGIELLRLELPDIGQAPDLGRMLPGERRSSDGERLANRTRAAGAMIVGGESPFAIRYMVECDPEWRARSVKVEDWIEKRALELRSDGEGNWTGPGGETVEGLQGSIDVDIQACVFTNTLPIRRLELEPRASQQLRVAYIRIPALAWIVADQRYTCLERSESGGLYRYESLREGKVTFTADLAVDGDGVVIEYPGLARRLRG